MGKNHRHKKNLKADRAKTQLKQTKTKFLPKGLNVTDTSFKIKSIVLPQQLKDHAQDVPLSKRKLNLKDLLTRLKHYNDNVRNTACEELSDMMRFHSEEIINQHLGQVILNISALMQDRERKVRKSAAKAVETILELTQAVKLQPFFNYFSTNLRCAMTNIDKHIQEDSLLFLDSLLKYNAELISLNAEKLLPDFFTLISKIRSDSSLDRTLTVNLKSKMTSVTWRIRVLSRLHAVLESILEINSNGKNTYSDNNVYFADNLNSIPMFKTSFLNALENNDVNIFDISSATVDKFGSLNKHIISLVPLLYETFLEVVPENKSKKSLNEFTALNEEAISVLSCVMSTLYLLWKYTQKFGSNLDVKDVFLSKEGKKFLDHLISNFPYCKTETSVPKKKLGNTKILESSTDSKCTKENILICYIYSILNVVTLQRCVKMEVEAIITFIGKTLLSKRYNNPDGLEYLLELLRLCLTENAQNWKRSQANTKAILENTIIFYNNYLHNEHYKNELFEVLMQIVNIPYLSRCPAYIEWLSSLPSMLCEPKVTDVEVYALLRLSRINNCTFHNALLQRLPHILDNLENLKIVIKKPSILNNEETVKRNIVNIFFFIPVFSEAQFRILQDFINNTKSNSIYRHYFEEMISLREQL